jgi:Ca-activated chloride channel homolog
MEIEMTTAILILDTPDVETNNRILGCIQVTRENRKMNLPLTSVKIGARVADRLAHVAVEQTFSNPYSDHLEAVYVFPLSGGCAVSSFEMKVGDRIVVGQIGEREEARAQYEEAIGEGKRAALMEQERDDVFTVQVGNLPPGESVTVKMTYSEKLPYFDNGTTEIRLPLVVSPRYIPGNPVNRESVGDGVELDTDLVPDASRITPPRLADGVDPKTAVSLTVELSGDQIIEDLSCSQHATRIGTSKDGVKVSLSREDELLNRDFVLRWRVAAEELQSNFLVYRHPENKDECYGMISLLPPKSSDVVSPPRDVLFVVDRSGSMNGPKMVSAARACSLLIDTLGPRDRFVVQAFDDVREWMGRSQTFVNADEAGKEEGNKYLRTITARGGTEMQGALQDAIAVMKTRQDQNRRLPVVIIITDGEVGNESGILKQLQSELDDSRIFTIGVDTAVNDGFLRRLARLGGGTASFVQPGAQLEDALSGVGREIGTPLITDLKIEDVNCGLDQTSIAPSAISDLFAGRASSSFFKFSAAKLKDLKSAKVGIKGQRVDGKQFSQVINARIVDVPALAQLWAKSHITDLEDQYRIADSTKQVSLHKTIVDVAVAHSLLTRFTAFIAVDHAEIVNAGGKVRKIVQPVHMPDQWALPNAQPFAAAAGSWGASAGSYGCPPQAPQSQAGGWGSAPRGMLRKQAATDNSINSPAPMSSPVPPSSYGAPTAPGFFQSEPELDAGLTNTPLTLAESIRRKIAEVQKDKKDQTGSTDKLGSILSNSGAVPASKSDAEQSSSERSPGLKSVPLRVSFEHFQTVLKKICEAIRNGSKPNSHELDEARMLLVKSLSNSDLAQDLPLLQKYLRAEVIQLIVSIDSATTISSSLKQLAQEHEILFEQVAHEVTTMSGAKGQFWRGNV